MKVTVETMIRAPHQKSEKHLHRFLAARLMAFAALALQPAIAAEERSEDAQGIDLLARSGSDLTALHNFEFSLRFPNRNTAERAELQLVGLAFSTTIESDKAAAAWVIKATKKMYPVESDLAGLRDKLNAIAAAERGVYEGWRAKPAAAAK